MKNTDFLNKDNKEIPKFVKTENLKSNPVLKTPIADLPVSTAFRDACQTMGLSTLEEIISIPVSELLRKEDFNYKWFSELLEILKQYRLTGQLKQ